jgi:hypothetical protein
LGWLAAGMTHQAIIADYPELTEDDILACLAYAADRERRLLTGAAAICLAQGLEHPGIRDPQRSQECKIGVTHCKHGGTGVGDKFCTPI